MYPNLVIKGTPLTIVTGLPGKFVTIKIFTSDGKLVYLNRQLAASNVQLPAPKFAGVYMVHVTGDGVDIKRKLVVE